MTVILATLASGAIAFGAVAYEPIARSSDLVLASSSGLKSVDLCMDTNQFDKAKLAIKHCTKALSDISRSIQNDPANKQSYYLDAAFVYGHRGAALASMDIAKFDEADADCEKADKIARSLSSSRARSMAKSQAKACRGFAEAGRAFLGAFNKAN